VEGPCDRNGEVTTFNYERNPRADTTSTDLNLSETTHTYDPGGQPDVRGVLLYTMYVKYVTTK